MRRHHSALIEALIAFAGLAFATVVLLAVSSALGGTRLEVVLDPIGWLARLDPAAAVDTLSNAAEVIAGVLGVAITVVAIVLELAANRYSHRITWLFVREPVNIVVLSLFVLTTLQCVWVSATIVGPTTMASEEMNGAVVIPAAGFALTLGLVTVSLLALLPYFSFVFAFLSPLNVIEKLKVNALERIVKLRNANIERTQSAVEEAVDELQDVARSAAEQSDRSIAMASVEALSELIEVYSEQRDRLPPAWFEIGPTIAADPDFVSLSSAALESIERSGTWLEVKIMEQYLALMTLCVPRERDIANLIAIKTFELTTGPGRKSEPLRALCIRCMNSYLRTTINAGDAPTTYYIMNQYRLIAEVLLEDGRVDEVLQIADHLKFYGNLGYEAGMPFLLETAAYDLVELIEADLEASESLVDPLLSLLLALDREIRDESQEKTLLGIRRSQMQLGTLFLLRGDTARVERVVADLATESMNRIAQVQRILEHALEEEYWEFTARGVNFAYLEPERRALVPQIVERVVAAQRERAGRGSN